MKTAPLPPDPDAILWYCCNRCDRIHWEVGNIQTECLLCRFAGYQAWPELGPIQGGVSGS